MALHYVHAYLSTKNDHPSSHDSLEQRINQYPELKPIYTKYRNLQDDSRSARYLGDNFTVYQMRDETLKWFSSIQNKVNGLLKPSKTKKYDLYNLFPLN